MPIHDGPTSSSHGESRARRTRRGGESINRRHERLRWVLVLGCLAAVLALAAAEQTHRWRLRLLPTARMNASR